MRGMRGNGEDSHPPSPFDARKAATLSALCGGADRSPKGSVDAPIAQLVAKLNQWADWVTTSSCSGRVSLFAHAGAKGGEWLYVTHEPRGVGDAAVVEAALLSSPCPDVTLRYEGFILAVDARNADAAHALCAAGRGAGLRESGVCRGAGGRHGVTLRGPTRLEAPVRLGGVRVVDAAGLEALVGACNDRAAANARRVARFEACLQLSLLGRGGDANEEVEEEEVEAEGEAGIEGPLTLARRRGNTSAPRGCCNACGGAGHRAAACATPRKPRRAAAPEEATTLPSKRAPSHPMSPLPPPLSPLLDHPPSLPPSPAPSPPPLPSSWPPARSPQCVPCPDRESFVALVLRAHAPRQPLFLRGTPIGPCVAEWNQSGGDGLRALTAAIGADKRVPVHTVAPSHGGAIDVAGHRAKNTPRNFVVDERPFGAVVAEMEAAAAAAAAAAEEAASSSAAGSTPPSSAPGGGGGGGGDTLYIRSVSECAARSSAAAPSPAISPVPKPSPAHLFACFPGLRECVALFDGADGSAELGAHPGLFRSGAGEYHSSVLRVASPGATVWPHWDGMDNILFQAVGTKIVTLFPPRAAASLRADVASPSSSCRIHPADLFLNDTSMSPTEFEAKWGGAAARAACDDRWEVTLRPGDALYIPALWIHATRAASGASGAGEAPCGPCVGFNVFFADPNVAPHRPKGFRDPFANRELPVVATAVAAVERVADALRGLPEPYRAAAARRAAYPLLRLAAGGHARDGDRTDAG